MSTRMRAIWRGMAARERRLVGVAAGVVLLALAWTVAVEPAWQGRLKLATELPRTRAQLAQLEAMAEEAAQIAAVPRTAESARVQRAGLEASVRAAGLTSHLAQMTVSGDLFDLRFKGVAFDAWLVWLEGALREIRLRVTDVEVSREPQPGRVSVRLILERPRGEDR